MSNSQINPNISQHPAVAGEKTWLGRQVAKFLLHGTTIVTPGSPDIFNTSADQRAAILMRQQGATSKSPVTAPESTEVQQQVAHEAQGMTTTEQHSDTIQHIDLRDQQPPQQSQE